MLAYTTLRDAGLLSLADTKLGQAFAQKTFQPQAPASDNQHYQRAAGLILAAQTFPNASRAAEWRKYATAVWQLVVREGDITEDAPNYNRIDLVYLWVLADLLGKTSELRASSFKAMFSRFAGAVPRSKTGPHCWL